MTAVPCAAPMMHHFVHSRAFLAGLRSTAFSGGRTIRASLKTGLRPKPALLFLTCVAPSCTCTAAAGGPGPGDAPAVSAARDIETRMHTQATAPGAARVGRAGRRAAKQRRKEPAAGLHILCASETKAHHTGAHAATQEALAGQSRAADAQSARRATAGALATWRASPAPAL